MVSAPVAPAEDDGLQVKVIDDDAIAPLADAKRVCISWENIVVKSTLSLTEKATNTCRKEKRTSRVLLNKIHGIVQPGQMLALMGTSGSGKTTLLNVINFKSRGNLRISGDIYINKIKADASMMAQVSCFVRQDDLFFDKLRVKEHLMLQAILRLDKKISMKEKKRKVNSALREFQLDICKSAYIMNISGGQKRRLSFATENLTDPQVLFCDEPTSGLDSHIAKGLIKYLTKLAASGKTIICTIHQPSNEIFNMFDSVCLLSNGEQAFFGPLPDAFDFFTKTLGIEYPRNSSPADFYLDCLGLDPNDPNSKQRVQARCDAYLPSSYRKAVTDQIESQPVGNPGAIFDKKASTYKASLLQQFGQLSLRCFKTYFRNKKVVITDLVMTILTGLLGGAIYFKISYQANGVCFFNQSDVPNISTAIFYSIMTMTIISTLGAVLAFPNEVPIIFREGEVYRVELYYLAKFLSEIPVYVVLPTLHTLIIYFMIVFGCTAKNFLLFWYTMILISNAAYSLGHLLSVLGGTVNLAISLAAPTLAIQILFSGFFLNKVKDLPGVLNAIKYISIFNYGYDLLMVNQWEIIENIACSNPAVPELCITNGQQVLDQANIDKNGKGFFIGMLTAFTFVLRFLTYVVLKYKLKKHKIKMDCLKKRNKNDAVDTPSVRLDVPESVLVTSL